ncbi:formylglycine-generating enzyme family protein [Tsuneonella mangrovi]|uniref:formylglycine-generating enzyme family protein n=1 Tax=Tsuneonella mangrovi TaxID=1982042 RepID=UPI000BA24642|nr:formylglycine-generating enzyme family protein [Tsuneonella mangrovi]
MLHLEGGTFTMGSERFYPEERPLRRVRVGGFRIDPAPVTNRQFAEFVAATGHITEAEIAPDPKDYPGMDPALVAPGSLVFRKTSQPVAVDDASQWWEFCLGADWRHPTGPGSSIEGLEDHPVVHVAYGDALAYAHWAGKALPTEAEWEYAARGGHEGREYQWGDELAPGGRMLANYWQGLFPFANTLEDGWERTSPVGSFPANDFGLFDMIGNVWEWTCDWYAQPKGAHKRKPGACCTIDNPRGGRKAESFDPANPGSKIGRRVLKGGSHLCAVSYCQRYRPAARQGEAVDTSTSHIGFRCIVRD